MDQTTTAAAERIWLKSYADITPAEIGELKYQSVGALIEDSCRRYASSVLSILRAPSSSGSPPPPRPPPAF